MFDYKIRELQRQEIPVLKEMLYHAVFVPAGSKPLKKEIINNPKISVYIDDWGKPDDYCLAAKIDGKIIGAVWIRILGGKIKGYGYIDDETPEFAISLLPEFRKLGIGTALMESMITYMKTKGYKQTSLSVDKKNYAVKIYQKLGFEIIKENRHDYLMLLKLNGQAKKSLHEMTPEELGKLFPIEIADYNNDWPKLYKKESRNIIKAVGENNIEDIYHIGSTSIKGLRAKPIIDILLEIKREEIMHRRIRATCARVLRSRILIRSASSPEHLLPFSTPKILKFLRTPSDAPNLSRYLKGNVYKNRTILRKMERALIKIGYEPTVQKDNPPPHMTFYKGYTVNGFLSEVYHLHIRYKGVQNELIFRDYLRKNPEYLKEYEELKLVLMDKFKNDRDGYTAAKTEFINKILKQAEQSEIK